MLLAIFSTFCLHKLSLRQYPYTLDLYFTVQQSSPLKSSLWTVQWHGKASVGLPARLRRWTSSKSIRTRLELKRRESEPNSKQEISCSEYNGQEATQAFMHIPCTDLSRCQHDTMWHIQNVAKQWRPMLPSSTFVASASTPHYHVEDRKHIYSFAHSFRAKKKAKRNTHFPSRKLHPKPFLPTML